MERVMNHYTRKVERSQFIVEGFDGLEYYIEPIGTMHFVPILLAERLHAALYDEREAHRETKSNLYSMTQDRNHFQRELSTCQDTLGAKNGALLNTEDSLADALARVKELVKAEAWTQKEYKGVLSLSDAFKDLAIDRCDKALARVKELKVKLAKSIDDMNHERRQYADYRARNPLSSVKPPEPEPVGHACPECGGKVFWHSRKCGRERQLTCNNDHDSCGARSGWFSSGEYYPRWLKKRPPVEYACPDCGGDTVLQIPHGTGKGIHCNRCISWDYTENGIPPRAWLKKRPTDEKKEYGSAK